MKQIYTLAIIIAVFYFPCLAAAQTGDVQQHADSLRAVVAAAEGQAKLDAYDKLTEYLHSYEADLEPLLDAFADYEREALRQGNQRIAAASRSNKILVMFMNQLYVRMLESADDDLKFLADLGEWNPYFRSYPYVITALFLDGQHDKAAEWADKCRKEAERIGTPFARASSLYTMMMLHGMNAHNNEALQYYTEAMRAIGDNSDPDIDQLKLMIYGYSIQFMLNEKDMEGMKKLLADWEAEIARQQTAGIDVWATRQNLNDGYMLYYSALENWDKMEEYCVLLESTPNINSEGINRIRYYRTKAEIARGNWDRALEHIDAAYKYAEQTVFQINKFVAMRERTRVMILSGRRDDAVASLYRTLELRDSISEMDFNKQLTELKTQYEVERHIAETQRSRNYSIFALGICLLLAVALGIYIYYNRKLTRKNRELVRKAQQWANIEPAPIIAEKDRDTDADELPDEEPLPKTAEPDETDKMIFAEIELLINRGLYKESSLSLDMLAEKTGQNPTYISKAVSHCTGKTFKVWLNEYRIKEAIRLLSDKNSPNITVETVAWDSGFNDRKTFHRIFKNTTGLSPAEFKKNELRK